MTQEKEWNREMQRRQRSALCREAINVLMLVAYTALIIWWLKD